MTVGVVVLRTMETAAVGTREMQGETVEVEKEEI
jgi:hypothetical protein